VSWLRRALVGLILIALLSFGAVADRALIEQERVAQQAALSDLEERARLTALSVRDTLARVEKTVLDGTPLPGVIVAQVAHTSNARVRFDITPYGKRDRRALVALLSSRSLTDGGLPEAVVAAAALEDSDERARIAERLLSGVLPVRPDDPPYLAHVLGVEHDPRLIALMTNLRRAPDPTTLPLAPTFRHALTQRSSVEAWSRSETGVQFYEIAASALLDQAGVGDRATLVVGVSTETDGSDRLVLVPEFSGLALAVALDGSAGMRIRMLRVALWIAILTSSVGLVVMVRAVARETRAVAKEKAFLASVTHELRTPLAAIRVFGETLADRRGNPPEYGALIAQESERLEALVERVLAITRVDEAPSFTAVKPDALVLSAMTLIAARAEQRSVRIDWQPGDDPLPETYWDADAVRRALLNLLDNAVKHGNRGGRVRVHSTVENDRVKLSVVDEGPGIGRRDRKRVFGRFERGSSDSPGTGLGLYVVEQVARAHGGRVDLVSDENQGCVFTLVLPICPPGHNA
jgi:signal transduction histidine kinase